MNILQLLETLTSFIQENLTSFIVSITVLIGAITALIIAIKSLVSLVSRFRSDSDSDPVLTKISPSDYREALSQSSPLPAELVNSIPKNDLYWYLCGNPISIGNMIFSQERSTGKKCLMIGAKGLSIAWGGSPQYWKWISLPESRFRTVAKLERVWWLHAIGEFDTSILSPQTTYEAFFVFKLWQQPDTFKDRPVQLYVHFEGRENKGVIRTFLDPSSNAGPLLPRERRDGWNEIKMGEFFNKNGEDGSVSCHMKEVTCDHAWSGLIIEGIEVRPKLS